jgi:hypothetical protein
MWHMPTDEEMGNILYNATSALREAGSPRYGEAIRYARILQAIVIRNRVWQEVGIEPGWGDPRHGTEPAHVGADADTARLAECRAAAQTAREIVEHNNPYQPGLTPRDEQVYYRPGNLYGAQLYMHAWSMPPAQWPMEGGGFDADTHLVASWGPFQDVEACIRAARERQERERAAAQAAGRLTAEELRHPPTGRIPACRGYIGVYVNYLYLGRAFASIRMGRLPHEVPAGRDKAEQTRRARAIHWDTLVQHNPRLQ